MLLRREQSWFAEILGGAYTTKFAGENDPISAAPTAGQQVQPARGAEL
jgi:hypothetical protein